MLSSRLPSPPHIPDLLSKPNQTRTALQELEANTVSRPSIDLRISLPSPKIIHRKPILVPGEAMDHGSSSLITPPPSSPYIDLRIPIELSTSVHIMTTSKPQKHSPAMVTPPPSSSPYHHHARTPSMSTCVPIVPDTVLVEHGRPLVIGRMAKPLDAAKTGPHLSEPGTVHFYTLPLKELEVSRLHIVLERVPSGIRLKAVGKNGLRVDSNFVGEGQVVILSEERGLVDLDLWVKTISLQCSSTGPLSPAPLPVKSEELEIKEYFPPPTATTAVFSDATVPFTPSGERHRTSSPLPPSSPASSPLSSLSSDDGDIPSPRGVKRKAESLPPSSPIKKITKADEEEDEDMDAEGSDEADQDKNAMEEAEDEVNQDDEDDDASAEAPLADEESPPSSPTPSAYSEGSGIGTLNENGKRPSSSPTSPSLKRPRTADAEADLRAAVMPHLVTALALSVTATTPLSHLLPDVLDQSSLAGHSHEEITRVCKDMVEDGVKGMFGKVIRHGKDASGHPLENLYFYKAENDPDRERAKNLGGFGRRVRGAQLTDKQYYWRPVGRRRS